jgi:hypothetical protein
VQHGTYAPTSHLANATISVVVMSGGTVDTANAVDVDVVGCMFDVIAPGDGDRCVVDLSVDADADVDVGVGSRPGRG